MRLYRRASGRHGVWRQRRPAFGRAFRQHIPLTTGEDVINFHPYGDAGLPVSGKAILAIQAFPLGCAKVAGRLLAVHSDNEELLLHFASSFLTQNRRLIQLAQEAGSTKIDRVPLCPEDTVGRYAAQAQSDASRCASR